MSGLGTEPYTTSSLTTALIKKLYTDRSRRHLRVYYIIESVRDIRTLTKILKFEQVPLILFHITLNSGLNLVS